jgi:hypothetical protein
MKLNLQLDPLRQSPGMKRTNSVQCGTASSNLSEFEIMRSIQEATGTSSRTAETCNGKDNMPLAGKQQT